VGGGGRAGPPTRAAPPAPPRAFPPAPPPPPPPLPHRYPLRGATAPDAFIARPSIIAQNSW